MELSFLGQGFEEVSANAVGNHIIEYLTKNDFHTFTAFSAFTSLTAIEGLKKYILEAPKNFKNFNFILGINQRGTSKEALEAILELKVSSFIFFHNPNLIFHPKIYLFEGYNVNKIIVGSSNLTGNGLFTNIESSILVTVNKNDINGNNFIREIKNYYKGIFDKNDPNLKPITQDLIDNLVIEGIIPTEKEQKAELNSKSKNKQNKSTFELFPKRKNPTIPKAFRKKTASVMSPKIPLDRYNKKTYLYTESSYHFPQGVHIGHILYALKTIKDKTIVGSHLDSKYVRLRGGLDSGDLGKFQRKAKYLLIALMEMEIIEDNRNLADQSFFKIKFTKKGEKLAKITTPLLDIANLFFKHKSSTIPSWEMVTNKKHYVSLLKALINSTLDNLLFWRDLISFPAVVIMHDLLKTAKEKEISKTDFIYSNFYSFKPTISLCKSLDIEAGTIESAKHRCPFLLDLLEIGSIIEQETRFVTLNKLAE